MTRPARISPRTSLPRPKKTERTVPMGLLGTWWFRRFRSRGFRWFRRFRFRRVTLTRFALTVFTRFRGLTRLTIFKWLTRFKLSIRLIRGIHTNSSFLKAKIVYETLVKSETDKHGIFNNFYCTIRRNFRCPHCKG